MTRRPLALALFATAFTLTTACGPAANNAANVAHGADTVLRAYDVPFEHAAELQGIVQSLLSAGKDQPRQGSAALAPTGQLLVTAPASFQPGIADVVERMRESPAVKAPTVTLDYWVVVGSPAAAATAGAAVAPEIGDLLDALQKSQGAMKLGLLERVRLSSQSGADAFAEGAMIRARQTAAVHGDKVIADVDVKRTGGQGGINARVEVPVGKLVVLGQAGTTIFGGPVNATMAQGAPAGFAAEAEQGTPLAAFYVLRATVDEAR